MNRRAVTVLIAVVAVLAAGVGGTIAWRNSHPPEDTASLLRRLPAEDATLLNLNVDALRQSGILKLLAGAPEPEYQSFLQASGFDYQRDLDQVLASFSPSGTSFLLRGRFDWPKLQSYAAANHGSCFGRLCRMAGSTPNRRISFIEIGPRLMGLAVGSDDLAASRLDRIGPPNPVEIPAEPLWLHASAAALGRVSAAPTAVRMFAQPLEKAEGVTATLGPNGQDFQIRLVAACRSASDAKIMAGQLTRLVALLRDLVKTKSNDLPGMLAAGSFSQDGQKVVGVWPLRRTLIDSLAGGG